MKLKITQKTDNALLKRVEVEGEVSFDAQTPSNNELAQAIAKEFKSKVELVVMKQVATKFSQKVARVSALVYKDEAALKLIEKDTKFLKKAREESEKKRAQEAAEAKEKAAKEAEEKKAQEEAAKAAAETKEEPAKEEAAEPAKAE
jgi:colicin import membrane protein